MHWYLVYYAVIFIPIIVIFQSLIIDKGLQEISYNVNNVISCGACRQINLLTPPSLYLCFWHSWVGAILDCIPQEVDSGGGKSVVSIIVIFRGFGGHTEYKKNKWKTGNQGSTCHRHILRQLDTFYDKDTFYDIDTFYDNTTVYYLLFVPWWSLSWHFSKLCLWWICIYKRLCDSDICLICKIHVRITILVLERKRTNRGRERDRERQTTQKQIQQET